ncbi:MAG: DUF1566 domain-containing protein [Candidatus Electrothrix sp. AUS3]|nr:DUF1566 domain-containing protein [Candidatus Electrothrix gigas]
MKKIILLAGFVAGGVALAATAFANNWLLYLPAIISGSGGGNEPAPNKESYNLLLFMPAILAGSQGGTEPEPPVEVTGALNDTGIITSVADKDDAKYGRDANPETSINNDDGHAGFSFTKLNSVGNALDATAESWSCVQDNVTGLIWSSDQKESFRWTAIEGLVNKANTESLCGKTDWRLPEVGELVSIISYDADSYTAGKTVDTAYFGDTQVNPQTDGLVWYWTATAVNQDNQWGVTFQPVYTPYNSTETQQYVSLSNTLATEEVELNPVRLVSGTIAISNFTPIGDGSTVQDNNTGLIWKRCLEGQTFSNGNCSGTGTGKTWTQALALDDGTWRVPNIKELHSLVGKEEYFPTPTTTTGEYVWSSSPYAGNTQNSWLINFKDGLLWNAISQNPTESVVYVRLVRNVPSE